MALRPCLVLAVAVLGLSAGEAAAGESIVGMWATPGRCGVPVSTVMVEPKRFSGDDFFCDFDTVSRQGDVVRWRGRCVFGDDAPKRSTVTARLQSGGLSYRIDNGGWNGPLQRCLRSAG